MSNVDLTMLVTASAKAAAEVTERQELAKSLCRARILAVADETAQINLAGAASAGLLTTQQTAVWQSGLQWVASMRATWVTLAADAQADLYDDDNWPSIPTGVAELGRGILGGIMAVQTPETLDARLQKGLAKVQTLSPTGLGAATQTAAQPTGMAQSTAQPASTGLAPPKSVADQAADIASQDSLLMRQAETAGLQSANKRGLLNSSMSAEASQNAALSAAAPLAQAQAGFENEAYSARLGSQLRKKEAAQEYGFTSALSKQEYRQDLGLLESGQEQERTMSQMEFDQASALSDQEFQQAMGMSRQEYQQQLALQDDAQVQQKELSQMEFDQAQTLSDQEFQQQMGMSRQEYKQQLALQDDAQAQERQMSRQEYKQAKGLNAQEFKQAVGMSKLEYVQQMGLNETRIPETPPRCPGKNSSSKPG